MSNRLGTKFFFKVFLSSIGILLLSFSAQVKASTFCDTSSCNYYYNASSANLSEGAISPSGSGVITTPGFQFTAQPVTGYVVSGWTVTINGGTVANSCGTANTCSITNPINYGVYEITVGFVAGTPSPSSIGTFEPVSPDVRQYVSQAGQSGPIEWKFTANEEISNAMLSQNWSKSNVPSNTETTLSNDDCSGHHLYAGQTCHFTVAFALKSSTDTSSFTFKPEMKLYNGAYSVVPTSGNRVEVGLNLVPGTKFDEGYVFCTGTTGSIGCAHLPTGTNPRTGHDYQLAVVSLRDNVSGGQPWGTGDAVVTYAVSETDGQANTDAIIAALGDGDYAAKTCKNYDSGDAVQNWYLPSKEEVADVYSQLAALQAAGADFSTIFVPPKYSAYWSSTQCIGCAAYAAFSYYFNNGSPVEFDKSAPVGVRCIRAD